MFMDAKAALPLDGIIKGAEIQKAAAILVSRRLEFEATRLKLATCFHEWMKEPEEDEFSRFSGLAYDYLYVPRKRASRSFATVNDLEALATVSEDTASDEVHQILDDGMADLRRQIALLAESYARLSVKYMHS